MALFETYEKQSHLCRIETSLLLLEVSYRLLFWTIHTAWYIMHASRSTDNLSKMNLRDLCKFCLDVSLSADWTERSILRQNCLRLVGWLTTVATSSTSQVLLLLCFRSKHFSMMERLFWELPEFQFATASFQIRRRRRQRRTLHDWCSLSAPTLKAQRTKASWIRGCSWAECCWAECWMLKLFLRWPASTRQEMSRLHRKDRWNLTFQERQRCQIFDCRRFRNSPRSTDSSCSGQVG